MKMLDDPYERVFFGRQFRGSTFDFLKRPVFIRYDCCIFAQCIILIDEQTENLAFTACEFTDCNINDLHSNEQKNVISRGNIFQLPLEVRQIEFEKKFAEALAAQARSRI